MGYVELDELAEQSPSTHLSLAALRAIVDGSPDGMVLTDEHGTILFVNPVIGSMLGFEPTELVGQPIEKLVPDRFRSIHSAHRTRYRANPTTRPMGIGRDLAACRKDGDEVPVEVSLSPVETEDGLRVVATVRDITERLAVDAHTNAVFHTIHAAHDAVYMFPVDTLQFSYVNQGAVDQVGYRSDELLGMSPIHLKPEFTESSFRSLLEPLINGESDSHVFTTIHRRKDGTDVPVEVSLEYPAPAAKDRPRVMVAVARDIGERLQAQRAIHEQEIRLQVLEDRERVARDLHDLVIQRLFATGMGLQAVSHLATHPQLSDRIAESVEQLDEAIGELRSAIFELTTVPISTAEQIVDRVNQAEAGLGHRPDLKITGDLESVASPVLDEVLPTLTEALSNIARHADATATTVDLSIDQGALTLTISDNGVGLDPEAPRGHGLSNMEIRAKRLGGTTTVFSEAGCGTRLTWSAPKGCDDQPDQVTPDQVTPD